MNDFNAHRSILSVSELTARIKTMLEENFALVWVTGEISNFRIPASGHFYFSLKDAQAQINAVMFRGQNMQLKFAPEDGMQINGLGRISLYEPRGTYQIILEYLEPRGVGALQVAFEQLKAKLALEGLFDQKHKKKIPFIPERIGIITSPTGSVIHDMLNVLNRRFPSIPVEIVPVKVQGDRAAEEIIQGIELLSQRGRSDVAILARGGGSLEDLAAFNSEGVVRAIFSSEIPVVSAVGHETDFTLADFVADLRAPTPSAAAEMVAPVKDELQERLLVLHHNLMFSFKNHIKSFRLRLKEASRRLTDPGKKIQDFRLRIDDLTSRLMHTVAQDLRFRRERLTWQTEKLCFHSPQTALTNFKVKLDRLNYNLLLSIKIHYNKIKSVLGEKTTKLQALSPTAILKRGYSITRSVPDGAIVRSAMNVDIGQRLEVLLADGSLHVNVDSRDE